MIAVGLLALSIGWVVAITFSLAYVAGFAMTVGPLMQGGMDFKQAFNDALWAETASITVMEIVAIGTDLWLAGDATMGEPLFWMSLFVSLSWGSVPLTRTVWKGRETADRVYRVYVASSGCEIARCSRRRLSEPGLGSGISVGGPARA